MIKEKAVLLMIWMIINPLLCEFGVFTTESSVVRRLRTPATGLLNQWAQHFLLILDSSVGSEKHTYYVTIQNLYVDGSWVNILLLYYIMDWSSV